MVFSNSLSIPFSTGYTSVRICGKKCQSHQCITDQCLI